MKAYHWKDILAERQRAMLLAKGAFASDAPNVQVNVPEIRQAPPAPTPPPPQTKGTPRPPPIIVAPAPIVTTRRVVPPVTPGKRICMECRHYARHLCTSEDARHPVTGMYVDAERARRYEDGCGPRARLWEARPSRTVDVAPSDDSEPMEYVPPVPVRRLEPFRDAVIAVLWQPSQ